MGDIVIFDTEYTAWEGSVSRRWQGPGEAREIVQIGAIILDAQTLAERDVFSVLVRPVLNPVLSDYFINLTGISQNAVSTQGLSFLDGVKLFRDFAKSMPLYCYGRDDIVISDNATLIGQALDWPHFVARNIGHWFAFVGFPIAGVNSGALARQAGVEFQARAHEAVNDSRSIAAAIRALVGRGAPHPFPQRVLVPS